MGLGAALRSRGDDAGYAREAWSEAEAGALAGKCPQRRAEEWTMPHDRLQQVLRAELAKLDNEGGRKGAETVIAGVVPAKDGKGLRYLIAGEGDKPFLRMNANNYLGLALQQAVTAAEDEGVKRFGSGPGAVRFIGGTWASHVALEQRLARFHSRAAAVIFSSAYTAMMGTLPGLVTPETAVISDELNHNCIIN